MYCVLALLNIAVYRYMIKGTIENINMKYENNNKILHFKNICNTNIHILL